MKKLALLIIISLVAQTANAGPHPIRWAKRHPFVVKEGAALLGASIHAYGLQHCRRGDVERCDAGYGSAWVMFGITTGTNMLIFVPLSEKCDHEFQGRVFCGTLGYGPSVAQTVWGIHEYHQYRLEQPHPPSMVNR
jgi:hypothetical protein